ncbi:MAG: hypothetical protein KIT15_07435 [Xanthobacteraceae bacterium]|nr:hypothetical protein [Xanthobacteraceae bacterium]
MIEESDGLLAFRQPLGWAARLLLAGGGVFALSVPHELLIRPGVPLLQWGMLPFWLIGLPVGLLGAILLLAGVLGLTRTVTFNAEKRELRVDGNGSFGIGWSERYKFSDILELETLKDEQGEAPPRFILHAIVAGAKGPLEIGTFESESEAIAAEAKIETLMLGEEGV